MTEDLTNKQPQPPGMAMRWVVFFLVFLVVYGVFFYRQSKRMEEQREAQAELIAEQEPAEDAIAPPDDLGEITAEAEPEAEAPEEVAEAEPEPEPEPEPEFGTLDEAPTVHVSNDLMDVTFTTLGAAATSWRILPSDYVAPVEDIYTHEGNTVELIPPVENREGRSLPLQLTGRGLADFNRVVYDVEQEDLENGGKKITFTSPVVDGMRVVKEFTFPADSFLVQYDLTVQNGEARSLLGDSRTGWGTGWQGGFMPPLPTNRLRGQILAAAAVDGELRTRTLDADDDPLVYTNNVGWAGQEKKYFAALMVPHPDLPADAVRIDVRRLDVSPEYAEKGIQAPMSVELLHDARELQPGEEVTVRYNMWVGPKDFTLIKSLDIPMVASAPPLSGIVFGQIFWGQDWIRPISVLLLRSLRWFDGWLNNWGLAIIFLVLVVKIILYPLSHWAIKNQAKSMAEQNKIRPEMERLNEKYKNDPQKKGQEVMKLYREHGINPLGPLRGCFPMLLQMPIFIALYILLDQSVELRGQSFLWIDNLSAPDRLIEFPFTIFFVSSLNLLPILMAISQYFTSKLMTANVTDPTQRQVMLLMPLVFVLFTYNFPAGLMLYWTVQNVWQIGHTVLTKRYVAAHDADAARTPALAAAGSKK